MPQYTEEQRRTQQHFDAESAYWYDVYQRDDSFASYRLKKQHQFVLDHIARTPNVTHVLDVGCGAGVTVLELAQQGYHASGIDIAPKMIERAQAEAQARGVTADFRVALAEALPYSDASFDVLIALGLLGNIVDDRAALGEMRRVLKPGGRVLLTMPNLLALDLLVALPRSLPIMLGSTRLRQPMRLLGNAARRLTGRAPKDVAALRFNQCVAPGVYIAHLRRHGFGEVRTYPLTFGPFKPLGFSLLSDSSSIRRSESMAAWVERHGVFGWASSILVYEALAA
jgi:2-polyprenyl-3-methyl-5-hydroxy-6-metoxy-1,4-benzoquinol methylase